MASLRAHLDLRGVWCYVYILAGVRVVEGAPLAVGGGRPCRRGSHGASPTIGQVASVSTSESKWGLLLVCNALIRQHVQGPHAYGGLRGLSSEGELPAAQGGVEVMAMIKFGVNLATPI